jgi:hypothetical protein
VRVALHAALTGPIKAPVAAADHLHWYAFACGHCRRVAVQLEELLWNDPFRALFIFIRVSDVRLHDRRRGEAHGAFQERECGGRWAACSWPRTPEKAIAELQLKRADVPKAVLADECVLSIPLMLLCNL